MCNTSIRQKLDHFSSLLVVKSRFLSFLFVMLFVSVTSMAQDKSVYIRGIVVNSNGEPLIGATVMPDHSVKDAVTTNLSGRFSIKADDIKFPVKLHINYVGYNGLDIDVSEGHTNLGELTLQDNSYSLNDVVVVGYGKQSRKLLTGAVSEVKGDLVTRATQDAPILSLQGHASGVYIEQGSGVPGGGSSRVVIRGDKSLLSNPKPLYIIDGVPYNSNEDNAVGYVGSGVMGLPDALGFINPDDIETIDVLKDADATAIYGTRGSNGVILITTKKGQSGKVKVNVQYAGTTQWISKRFDYVDTETYLDIRRKAFAADVERGDLTEDAMTEENFPDLLLFDQHANYDWQDLMLGNKSWGNDIKASISGGNRNTAFFISGGFYNTDTPALGDDMYKRWTMRSNVTHHSTDNRLNVEAGFSLSQLNIKSGSSSSGYDLINAAPNTPPFDENGDPYYIPENTNFRAPLFILNYNARNKATNVTINFTGSYRIWDNLVAKMTVGFDHSVSNQENLYKHNWSNPYQNNAYADGRYYTQTTQSLNLEPQLTYTHDLFGGAITALVGGTYQSNDEDVLVVSGENYPGDMFLRNASAMASVNTHNNPSYQSKLASFFSRISYDYNNRYLFNAVFRRDGSSKFGPDHRWGNFWSVGGGWIFSNEKFLKDKLKWLNFGKIRMSYGKTGSASGISDYQYMSMYSTSRYPYEHNVGMVPNNLGNPNLHWESTNKFDVGLSLGFLNDRIVFDGSYYNERSKDLLMRMYLPYQTGFQYVVSNQPAEIENSGFEMEINTVNIQTKDWKWTTSLNMSFPKNKLLKYPGLETSSYANTYEIGKSVNIYRGYKYKGVNPENGVPEVEDINGDGKIDRENDYVTLGSADATFYGGLSNTIKFKGFTLDVDFYFRRAKYKRGYFFYFYYPIGNMYNITKDQAENYWTTPGQSAKYPALTTLSRTGEIGSAMSSYVRNSDFVFSSGSYLRLSNLRLAYDFPVEWVKHLGMQAAQLYVQGRNLFVISGYDSYDPETGDFNVSITKSFSFGINLTF